MAPWELRADAHTIPANISSYKVNPVYNTLLKLFWLSKTVSQNVIPSVHEVPVDKVRGQGSGGVFNYTGTVKTRLPGSHW